ncbi:hypothetical protein MRB53_038200 [Persea americana]|nr:hypothetical protein MRB53_038200 [Persea americana]
MKVTARALFLLPVLRLCRFWDPWHNHQNSTPAMKGSSPRRLASSYHYRTFARKNQIKCDISRACGTKRQQRSGHLLQAVRRLQHDTHTMAPCSAEQGALPLTLEVADSTEAAWRTKHAFSLCQCLTRSIMPRTRPLGNAHKPWTLAEYLFPKCGDEIRLRWPTTITADVRSEPELLHPSSVHLRFRPQRQQEAISASHSTACAFSCGSRQRSARLCGWQKRPVFVFWSESRDLDPGRIFIVYRWSCVACRKLLGRKGAYFCQQVPHYMAALHPLRQTSSPAICSTWYGRRRKSLSPAYEHHGRPAAWPPRRESWLSVRICPLQSPSYGKRLEAFVRLILLLR